MNTPAQKTLATSLDVLSLSSLALSLLPSFRSLALSIFFSLSLLSLFIYVHILVDIHADVERGMAEEHLQQPDSKEGVTTNNYGVRYTHCSLQFVTNLLTRLSFLAHSLTSITTQCW